MILPCSKSIIEQFKVSINIISALKIEPIVEAAVSSEFSTVNEKLASSEM
jgi:hypothetical protein